MEVYAINIGDDIVFSSLTRTDVALFQLTYLRGFFGPKMKIRGQLFKWCKHPELQRRQTLLV